MINDSQELLEMIFKQFTEERQVTTTLIVYFTSACDALLSRDNRFLKIIHESGFQKILAKWISNRNFNDLIASLMSKSHARKKFKESAGAMMNILIDKVFEAETSQNAQVIICSAITEDEDFYLSVIDRIEEIFKGLEVNDKFIEKSLLKIIKSVLEKEKDMKGVDEEYWGSEKTVECIISYGIYFKTRLEAEDDYFIASSFGCNIIPAGENVLIILEILTLLVEMNHEQVNNFLIPNTLCLTASNVFERYPWNSLLHNIYVVFITSVLESPLKYSTVPDLIRILTKYCLNLSINDASRVGLVGHCWKLVEILCQAGTSDDELNRILTSTEVWPHLFQKMDQINRIEFILPHNFH